MDYKIFPFFCRSTYFDVHFIPVIFTFLSDTRGNVNNILLTSSRWKEGGFAGWLGCVKG